MGEVEREGWERLPRGEGHPGQGWTVASPCQKNRDRAPQNGDGVLTPTIQEPKERMTHQETLPEGGYLAIVTEGKVHQTPATPLAEATDDERDIHTRFTTPSERPGTESRQQSTFPSPSPSVLVMQAFFGSFVPRPIELMDHTTPR